MKKKTITLIIIIVLIGLSIFLYLSKTNNNNKDNNLVISEYGKENIEKYSTIRSYFTTKLKYSCVYKITE